MKAIYFLILASIINFNSYANQNVDEIKDVCSEFTSRNIYNPEAFRTQKDGRSFPRRLKLDLGLENETPSDEEILQKAGDILGKVSLGEDYSLGKVQSSLAALGYIDGYTKERTEKIKTAFKNENILHSEFARMYGFEVLGSLRTEEVLDYFLNYYFMDIESFQKGGRLTPTGSDRTKILLEIEWYLVNSFSHRTIISRISKKIEGESLDQKQIFMLAKLLKEVSGCSKI